MKADITPSKECILIVDDNKENLDLLNDILIDDYTIKAAVNGKTALKIAERFKPDMILLDIMMPEMDGLEVCKRLKLNPITKNIPVIFVTAKSEDVDEALGFKLGAVDYISKPISALIVKARVKTHFALSNQKKELSKAVILKTDEVRQTRNEIIKMLGRAAEYKDNETGTHIIRVGEYAYTLAISLNIDEETALTIKEASKMHDIGKIGIPDRILKKPGKLDRDEYAIMKNHTQFGSGIIGNHPSDLLKMAAIIALQHHERYDGKGYPYGLKGDDITICSKIVSLCDVFDALTSRRPYKEPWEYQKAVTYITKQSGKQFDPKVVNAFTASQTEISVIYNKYKEDFAIS